MTDLTGGLPDDADVPAGDPSQARAASLTV